MIDLSNAALAKPVALVLGATGGVGGALAEALLQRGYRVRAMHRRPHHQIAARSRFEWVSGDAMNAGDVLRAAEGASVILHGVNPPGDQNWGELVLPMIDNTIAAARAVGRPRIFTLGFPWWLAGLARRFVPLLKELHEMRYLWRETMRLDNCALVELLGEEPRTPIDVAVKATLRSLGCLPETASPAVRNPETLVAGGGQ